MTEGYHCNTMVIVDQQYGVLIVGIRTISTLY